MTITWFGHSCFHFETRDGSVLIDPFSKEIGLRPPKIKEDILLLTHKHYDHAGLTDIGTETFVISGPGEYERKGFQIRGIQSYHDKAKGAERGLNTIYTITAEDMTICHLGDFGEEKLSDEQLDNMGEVDILIVPVGGAYTLNSKEAVAVVGQVEPKIIIPMHYRAAGVTIPDLESVDKFIKEISLTPEKVDKLRITRKTLPTEETKLVVFEL